MKWAERDGRAGPLQQQAEEITEEDYPDFLTFIDKEVIFTHSWNLVLYLH